MTIQVENLLNQLAELHLPGCDIMYRNRDLTEYIRKDDHLIDSLTKAGFHAESITYAKIIYGGFHERYQLRKIF